MNMDGVSGPSLPSRRAQASKRVLMHVGRIAIGMVLLYVVLAVTGFAQERFLTQPMGYGADTPAVYGWNGVEYVNNNYKERIGAPFGVRGRPVLDRVRCVLFAPDCTAMWAIGKLSGSIITGVNVYFFLTYFLCYLTALYGLRFFGVSWPISMTMGLLYALLPYHQMQGVNHLYESTYFVVPIYGVILYLIYGGAQALLDAEAAHLIPGDRYVARSWFFVAALLFVFFPASLQPYHQFFFALFAGFAGILGSVDRRSWRPFALGLLFAAVACAGLVIQTALDEASWGDPHHWVHTVTQLTRYGEDEMYPLKLIQMLLFIPGHRIELFATLRSIYDAGHPLVNTETSSSSLGLIAAFGFLGLTWVFLTSSRLQKPLRLFVARLVLFGLLLGVMGGLGTILSELSWTLAGPSFPLSQARGWNRVIIFIGFFALLAAGWGIDKLIRCTERRSRLHPKTRPVLAWAVAIAVFTIGAWDQVERVPRNIFSNDDAIYASDHAFFGKIDGLYASTYQVFQWPAMVPWGGSYGSVYYTDAYRPLLNSRGMHLSFGADPSSKQGRWLAQTATLPPLELFDKLCGVGFQGVVVHTDALVPQQNAFVDLMKEKSQAMVSGRGLTYFDIRRACGSRSNDAAQCVARARGLMLDAEHGERAWIGADQFAGTTGVVVGSGPCGSAVRQAQPGQSGWLTIGPYVSVKPGEYVARFEFLGNAHPRSLQVDWQDGKTSHLLAKLSPGEAKADFELPFGVAGTQQLLEFRVSVDGSSNMVFRGVMIERR